MEQSEIIRMAQEAGFKVDPIGTPLIFPPDGMDTDVWVEIQRFAALVAAHEREACAKVCEEMVTKDGFHQAEYCATAIRERGENGTA